MWWPNGRMAGTVQEQGRIYSIRHMGGPIYAMIEMGGDRMPQEHAPMPAACAPTTRTRATIRWSIRATPAC